MMKQKNLNRWLWKWHVIGGLISLPFLFFLAVTGAVYLFKADYNNMVYDSIQWVEPDDGAIVQSYNQQIAAVQEQTDHPIVQVFVPESSNQATGFRVHGKGHSRDVFYVNPYTAEVTDRVQQKQTLMYKVRKLHGELLLGKGGEWFVELVASWAIVLILTGLYVWWPAKKFSLASFFVVRTGKGRRTFWRDVHAVFGFWLSLFLLVILAGGMPWTDIFGSQLKWVQAKTDTGYPKHWRSSKGLKSDVTASSGKTALSLDDMVAIALQKNLEGRITVKLPRKSDGVFSVSNKSFWLRDQHVFHFDQYTGDTLKAYRWSDVGILMELRQIAMRLHQGEYGFANWLIVLIVSLLFAVSTVAGLISYLLRKPEGRWGMPTVPEQFKVGKLLFLIIIGLGVLFPLFGLSLLVLCLFEFCKGYSRSRSVKNKVVKITPTL